MEHQRVPKNTVTRRDEHWCHFRNAKWLGVHESTRDEAHFPFIGSIAILVSTAYSTSGLTSFRKLHRFPETTVPSLYEYFFSIANRGKLHAPHIISRWELIPLSLTKEVSRLSTSTSSGVFPQKYVCERDPVFSVSIGMDQKRPWLKRRVDFPAVA